MSDDGLVWLMRYTDNNIISFKIIKVKYILIENKMGDSGMTTTTKSLCKCSIPHKEMYSRRRDPIILSCYVEFLVLTEC